MLNEYDKYHTSVTNHWKNTFFISYYSKQASTTFLFKFDIYHVFSRRTCVSHSVCGDTRYKENLIVCINDMQIGKFTINILVVLVNYCDFITFRFYFT